VRKLMPTEYSLPEDARIGVARSGNQTINLCEKLKLKANIISNLKTETRKPLYMQASPNFCDKSDNSQVCPFEIDLDEAPSPQQSSKNDTSFNIPKD